MQFLALAVAFATTEAFVPSSTSILRSKGAAPKISLQASATEATSAFAASQAETIAAIQTAIPELSEKLDASWAAGAGETVAGAAATLAAFDAPGPPNVAWVSSLAVEGKLSALTIFNGPLTDVPHVCSRVAITEGGTELALFMDWRPRAYGAYETRNEDGSYPGPDVLGREAFAYSGARMTMEKNYYTAELETLVADALGSFEGAVAGPAPASEFDALTRGPLAVDVRMPLTDANVAAVARARAAAAAAWLQWQAKDEFRLKPGAPVNSQYVFDTPAKQNMYSALLATYSALFGAADGAKLAAADSGPLDEAYVGGAS